MTLNKYPEKKLNVLTFFTILRYSKNFIHRSYLNVSWKLLESLFSPSLSPVSSHRRIQRDLEIGLPFWAPKLGAQKSFLVQTILSSAHSDK